MKIHQEGHKILRNQIIIYLLIGIITDFSDYFTNYITPFLCLIFIFSLYFFRTPTRLNKFKDGLIYAPCDGKVVVIEETIEKEYFKDKRIQVSIFMSPLNIHSNLYPISGAIKHIKYHPGKFLFAWNPKASEDNEMNSVVIKNKNISVLVKQIAGALARRIISYSKLEDKINVGDELGFIKFGSRVDVFLPLGTKLKIKIKEKVKGGKTVIGSY